MYIAGASTAVIAIPTGYYYFGALEYDKSLALPQLLSNIWDAETIAEIGKSYLKQYPAENSERKLVSLLSESISTQKTSLTESIEWRIKEDYQAGNIRTIEGWVLSTTEGRQCALYSLAQ